MVARPTVIREQMWGDLHFAKKIKVNNNSLSISIKGKNCYMPNRGNGIWAEGSTECKSLFWSIVSVRARVARLCAYAMFQSGLGNEVPSILDTQKSHHITSLISVHNACECSLLLFYLWFCMVTLTFNIHSSTIYCSFDFHWTVSVIFCFSLFFPSSQQVLNLVRLTLTKNWKN